MPIARIKNKTVYFSHIPKCGGTSVEDFLKLITGGELSFLDRKYYDNEKQKWSISSPQHITGNDISKLFPINFFDVFFTVTRHPFDRFYSAFIFHKYYIKTIAKEIDVNHFVGNLVEYKALLPGQYDNHFLPQVNFLYPGAPYKAFKLENGLDNVKKYIGALIDIDVDNLSMPHKLKRPKQLETNENTLDDNSKKIIKDVYKLDFEKFKYQ